MKKGLIVTSIVLMFFSLIGMLESSRLQRTMKMGIGIGFLPFWMSAIIGILALILLINAIRGRYIHQDVTIFHGNSSLRVLFLAIALALYISLIDVIGYVSSTFLFLFFSILLLKRYRIINVLISAALFTFILYAIFKLWLKSPLPTGLIGI